MGFRLFDAIQIQTISWCNRSCVFCPSGKFEVPKRTMDIGIYKKIMDELATLSFEGRISPYLMNEATLDKRLPELVSIAKESCPKALIWVSTNGDLLNEERIVELFDLGLNVLLINLYDEEQLKEKIELVPRLIQNHKEISFSPLRSLRSSPDSKVITMRALIGLKADSWTNRSGNVPGAKVILEPLKKPCPRPFRQMYINYLGEALLCCNDWRFEVRMGSLNKQSLVEIWNNNIYQKYRRHLSIGDRNIRLCDRCDY